MVNPNTDFREGLMCFSCFSGHWGKEGETRLYSAGCPVRYDKSSTETFSLSYTDDCIQFSLLATDFAEGMYIYAVAREKKNPCILTSVGL